MKAGNNAATKRQRKWKTRQKWRENVSNSISLDTITILCTKYLHFPRRKDWEKMNAVAIKDLTSQSNKCEIQTHRKGSHSHARIGVL